MRILITTDAVGGVWTYALDLARGLAARGIDSALAVLGPSPSDAQRAQVCGLDGLQLYEHCGKLEWMPEPWADVDASGAWLRAVVQQYRPDVVHLNGYAHGAIDFGVPSIVVGHSCVLSWWQAVRRERCPAEWTEYQRRVSRGLSTADAVVAPTSAMAIALIEHYGLARLVEVIYNGRDRSLFSATAQKRPLIFSAGRLWDEAKNVAALQRVAPRSPWPIYVAGDARDGHAADDSYAYLGRLAPRKVAAWMRRAAIYAAPARYEPFGLSILEAALSGCALVLGDIPTLREIWSGAAWFVPPDDDDELARVLAHVATHPEERRRMADRARDRAAWFSLEQMAGEYVRLYRTVTQRRARGGMACAS